VSFRNFRPGCDPTTGEQVVSSFEILQTEPRHLVTTSDDRGILEMKASEFLPAAVYHIRRRSVKCKIRVFWLESKNIVDSNIFWGGPKKSPPFLAPQKSQKSVQKMVRAPFGRAAYELGAVDSAVAGSP